MSSMLDQYIASLRQQGQPTAVMKTRLTKDLILEKKQTQNFVHPAEEHELSYYKYLAKISHNPAKWQFDFEFSDGSRT